MSTPPPVLTPDQVEALERDKAQHVRALRDREAAFAAATVAAVVPRDGITSLPTQYAQPGKDAVVVATADRHAAVKELLEPLVRRARSVMTRHGQLIAKHHSRRCAQRATWVSSHGGRLPVGLDRGAGRARKDQSEPERAPLAAQRRDVARHRPGPPAC